MSIIVQYPAILDGLLDPAVWIDRFGVYAVWGAALVIFIECWLFPFLPGDSLLFTAGVLIAGPGIPGAPLWLACVIFIVSAVLSNVVGYGVGYYVGPKIFDRPDSRFFKREYIDRTHEFFDRHGPGAIILARFVPIVRTFITLAAGAGRMPFRRYLVYTGIGGVLWVCGVLFLGYFLGQIPWLAHHVEAILVGLVAFSVVPVAWQWWSAKREAAQHDREAARHDREDPGRDGPDAARPGSDSTLDPSAPEHDQLSAPAYDETVAPEFAPQQRTQEE